MQKRIAGRQLQRIRRRWFDAHPLCVQCKAEGRVRIATQLDHIVALVNGGADDDGNRQPLCADCHAAKTRADLGHGPSGECDAQGWPVDPLHPWNKAGP